MYEKIAELMQWRSDLLISERFEDLSREYLFPLVVYQGDRQIVLETAEEFVAVYVQLRAAQRKLGVTKMIADITAVDLPRHGRLRVWIRYYDVDALGRKVSQTDVTQYCRETPNGLKTELVEYGRCTIPEIWEERRTTKSLGA